METINLPMNEYKALKNELQLLRNQELLKKVNDVIDVMFENKYGLYLGNYTDDLTDASVNTINEWQKSGDCWNEV